MTPRHNLPKKTYRHLVGRDDDLRQVMSRLASTSSDWVVPLEGQAGVGKTALALEAAYHCVNASTNAPRFNAVIWVSAAPREPAAPAPQPFVYSPALDQVLVAIADVLGARDVPRAPREKQAQIARNEIKQHEPILLILDGLDTADDRELLRFLTYDIPRDNPARRSKVIVTLHYTGDFPHPIELAPLTLEQTVELILFESRMRRTPMDRESATALGRCVRGIPFVAHLAVGWYHEYGLEDTVQLIEQTTNISDTFLREIVRNIQQTEGDSYRLLLALACFDIQSGVESDLLRFVSGMAPGVYQAALRRLEDLELVLRHSTSEHRRQRVALLPITHRYLRRQEHDQSQWVHTVYDRAITSLRRFIERADDRAGYEELRPEALNISEVMRWLTQQHRLADLAWFFQRVADLLFAEAHWNALIEYAEVLANWAVSARDTGTMRAVLRQPIDVCARRNEMKLGNYWLDLARDLVERQFDLLLSAEIALARARLLFGNGSSISSVYKQPSPQFAVVEAHEIERDLERSLAIFEEHDGEEHDLQLNVVLALNTLGLVARSRMDVDHKALAKAGRYYERALDTIHHYALYRPELETWEPIVLSNLAIVAGREGQYAQACEQLRDLLDRLMEISEKAQANAVIAYYSYLLHEEERAFHYRRTAEDLKSGLELGETFLCREDRLWASEIRRHA